jgi:putative membrane protein
MNQENRTFFAQYMITMGIAFLLAEKLVDGKLSYYINTRFFPLTVFAILVLILLACFSLLRRLQPSQSPPEIRDYFNYLIAFSIILFPYFLFFVGDTGWIPFAGLLVSLAGAFLMLIPAGHTHSPAKKESAVPSLSLIFMSIPLIIGLIASEQPLSSSALNNRGLSLTSALGSGQTAKNSLKVIEDDRTILDWIKLFNSSEDHAQYAGSSVNVIGFVYHDARLPEGQFMVSRFIITCCVADAFALGMPVEATTGNIPEDNTWVNVKGALDITMIDGKAVPLILASSIETVNAPEQPYLYP